MQAMILAAGLGTRLRPYSTLRPKPLFPVLNSPLLLNTIQQLRNSGCQQMVINAFHLGDQIADLVKDEADIIFQKEEVLLGTGGGLKQAQQHFSSEPVLVVNGDICHSIDLKMIIDQHKLNQSRSPVSLVLHDHERFNSVAVDSSQRIVSFDKKQAIKSSQRRLAFTGIHVIEPKVLDAIPSGLFYNIIDCYVGRIQKGIPINAIEVDGHYWTDMGTPADYLKMHEYFLAHSQEGYSLDLPKKTTFLTHDSSQIGKDVVFNDWVCIGDGAKIGHGADLSRVVVWGGASVPEGATLRDTIIS